MRTAKVRALPVKDSESKYRAIFEQSTDAIATVLTEGFQIDAANQAFEELTGYVGSELAGRAIQAIFPDAARAGRSRPFGMELLQASGTYEDVAILRNDGQIRYVDLSVRPVVSGASELILIMLRDMTEKKRMERELIAKHSELRDAFIQLEKKNAELSSMQETLVQAGKLAALGELAAGIAHEINQPLMGIRGYAQELQSVLPPSALAQGEVSLSLKEIISNADKMAGIIGYMREFTRKSTEKHEWTDLHAAIEEALKMLSRQFAARGITVERRFGAGVPRIFANPLQLEQVFINLATNARDAIEATGRGSGRIEIATRQNGDFIEVDFKDDGCGMNERTRSRMFNPFFTTKEVGKGMGLGLSLSYGILSKLSGSILVESELGKGAAFKIRIPKDYRELA